MRVLGTSTVIRTILAWLFALTALVAAAEKAVPLPFPNLAASVGELLEEDYYDHSRFQPRLMVERALRALGGAELKADATWVGDEIVLHIAERTWRIPAPVPADVPASMALIDGVRDILEGEASLPMGRGRELGYAMLNGALLSLDPHTVLMSPEPADNFEEDIRGEFGGIGAYLHQDAATSEIIIEHVMPERPAEKAGVEDGDVVIAVDGESTAGLSLDQAVKRIKGPKGTTVRLSLRRKADSLDLSIVRDTVQVPTMRSWRDASGVGYIRMDEFNQNTAKMLFAEVTTLEKIGPLAGLVLDLRFNGGGLLEQARVISDFFLEKDLEIVRTVTVEGPPHKYFSSPRELVTAPMIVLVGPGSASAAEILSGALQCNDRAVIAGATTFGKGSVQTVRPLRDGSRLKLTIQEYQLAGGVSIQDVGVSPDVRLLRRTQREDGRVDLAPFSPSREHDEEFSLAARNTYQHATAYEFGWLAHELSKEVAQRSAISARDFVPDQEATLAIELLREALAEPGAAEGIAHAHEHGGQRQALLRLLATPVAKHAESEATELAAALTAQPVPVLWGPDTAIALGSLVLTFVGPDTVKPGETAHLRFRITNHGTVEVGRLYGVVEADRVSPFFEEEVVFGAIAPGATNEAELVYAVPPRLYPGDEHFTLRLRRDGQIEPVLEIPALVHIEDAPRPQLACRWALRSADGLATLQAGGDAVLMLTVLNEGTGTSSAVGVSVYKDNSPWVELGNGSVRLEPIAPGDSATAEVMVKVLGEREKDGVRETCQITSLDVQIAIDERFPDATDARYRAVLFDKLALPVGAPALGGEIREPHLSLVGVQRTAEDTAVLTIAVAGTDLGFLACFREQDKLAFAPATALKDGRWTVTVPLIPGLNGLRVVAGSSEDALEYLPIRIWGPAAPVVAKPLAVPVAAPASEPVPQPEPVMIP